MQTQTTPEKHNWEFVGRRRVNRVGAVTVNRARYFVSTTIEKGTEARIYRDAQGLAAVIGQSQPEIKTFRLRKLEERI